MPFVQNYWLWKRGTVAPPSTGYARIAQGRCASEGSGTPGYIGGREYDLTSFTVTLSSNFSKLPGSGNAESNGSLGLYDLASPAPPIANDLWNYTTRATLLTSNFQGAALNGWTQACSNASFATILFVECQNGATISNVQARYNFATQNFTTLQSQQGNNSPIAMVGPSCQYQAVGTSVKGFFYTGSIVYSTNVWASGDGPNNPPEPTNSELFGSARLALIWNIGGTVSDGAIILTQAILHDTSTSFYSQHYTISSDVTVAGPNFVFTFPPLTSFNAPVNGQAHCGATSMNGGISGQTIGSFFEKGNTLYLTGTASAQIEDYAYASGTVTQRSGLVEEPEVGGGGPVVHIAGYFFGAPSDPGNF